ncbi:CD99 antigen-like protein 2 isoform X2 [Leuresthes tenuis]|uniref:CD99 antigen-like protein 2 isoform X2 n=1 Tax=Leuresthes tenuis TaxID=355514 RepID=UPI003B51155C
MVYRSLCTLCLLLQLFLPMHVTTPKPGAQTRGTGGEFSLEDLLFVDGSTTTTKATSKIGANDPAKSKPKPAVEDFDLADALDPKKDIYGKNKNKGQEGEFSDSDLIDVSKDNTYKPDKSKGGHLSGDSGEINQHDNKSGTTEEVGTIAGIASAVAMALVGAISSYISYQKKKLCFSIQQSLNTDMCSSENPEAVLATEPQVQQILLEPPNAERRTEGNAV